MAQLPQSKSFDFSDFTSEEAFSALLEQSNYPPVSSTGTDEKAIEQLKEENTLLTSQVDTLRAELALVRKELDLHRKLVSEEHLKTLMALKEDYDTISASRREAFDILKNHYTNTTAKLSKAEASIHVAEANMSSQLQSIHAVAYELYQQLNLLQVHEAALAAKTEVERSSHATLVVDKLGSLEHPDTSMLSNVTATTLASMKGAQPGETTRLALCTRDQVRLVVTGALAEQGALGDVSWFRSRAGSAFMPVYNAGGRARLGGDETGSYADPLRFIPSIDDLFCTLRAQFTDPMSGASVSAEIGPVLPDRELVEAALEAVRKSECEYRVLVNDEDVAALEPWMTPERSVDAAAAATGMFANIGVGIGTGSSGPANECLLQLSRRRVKVTRGKKVALKQGLEEGVHTEPQMDSDVAFTLYIHGHGITCEAKTRQERDAIIALSRLFILQHVVWSHDGWDRVNHGLLGKSDAVERQRERVYSVCYLMSHMNQHMLNAISATVNSTPQIPAYPPPPMVTDSSALRECSLNMNAAAAVIEGKCVDFYNTISRDNAAQAGDASSPRQVDAEASPKDGGATPGSPSSPGGLPRSDSTGFTPVRSLAEVMLLHTLPVSFDAVLSGQAPKVTFAEFAVRAAEALSTATVEFSSGRRRRGVPQFNSKAMGLSGGLEEKESRDEEVVSPTSGSGEDGEDMSGMSERDRARAKRMAAAQASLRAASVNDFVPADIDDLMPTGQAKPGERGFGDLVQRGDDSDSEDEGAEKGEGGAERKKAEEEEEMRPAIRVVIKDKETATVASSADVRAALGESGLKGLGLGMGPSSGAAAGAATGAATGAGRRGRKAAARPAAGVGSPEGGSTVTSPASSSVDGEGSGAKEEEKEPISV